MSPFATAQATSYSHSVAYVCPVFYRFIYRSMASCRSEVANFFSTLRVLGPSPGWGWTN